MSNETLSFAMKMIEQMAAKDPVKGANAAIELHRSEQFRTDLMTVVLPALTVVYSDFKAAEAANAVRANLRLDLDAKRVEIETVRAATARTEADAEADKTKALARLFGASEYRLTEVLTAEVERRVSAARRNGTGTAEDHLDG